MLALLGVIAAAGVHIQCLLSVTLINIIVSDQHFEALNYILYFLYMHSDVLKHYRG